MPSAEVQQQYAAALKAGQKCYREAVLKGEYPYPQVLDEILDEHMAAGRVELGVLNIPMEQIVGTMAQGRRNAFAANFMPLLPMASEFGTKWMALCEANLSNEGIRDPIRCYEYLGRFYVQEGNKRVSVLKSFDSPSIAANVVRIIPPWSEDEEIRVYYEFLEFYALSKLYRVHFSHPGQYRKLQAALGFEPDRVWTEDERRSFLAGYATFEHALANRREAARPSSVSELFLLWLQLYSLAELKSMSAKALGESIAKILPDARLQAEAEPINMSTEPEQSGKSILSKIIDHVLLPGHLNVAFINDRSPADSPWVYAHDRGRRMMEDYFGEKLSVRVYTAMEGCETDLLFDAAVEDGAQVIFATTPTLIASCRKAAAKYPDCKILNCSVSMPFPGVRTYYSRIYEAKFISGAVAGAMTRTNRIGYIASNPIYGVPAGINAFALGAKLTNPDVEVFLRWTCVSQDAISELRSEGCDMIANRDVTTEAQAQEAYGLCRAESDGALTPILSPVWSWGEFYIHLVQSIFSGAWEELGEHAQKAVNYWWGLSSGVVDIRASESLPVSMAELVDILKRGVISGLIAPFCRRITAQDGRLINDGGHALTPEEILHIDWLCDFIRGSIPSYDELLPFARSIVRLQGVYRESIPPEKDGVQL
ncbi:MAG: BMP family ABC transporter substrate-binding protein [Oscillospiraceae bacterium]|nr:BMP family ABC transporter substrate-binding protein [Oscillospiraceae bacterium]